ncbi:hypothetical protein ACIBEJ_08915 [Nonomuraea sp. NPDC050790]|uniref:hypothetical protein n=1 Tax=Nonomuraea sp. NPDC050790 TaxID=3364371 RepID=UPI0037A8BF42
MINLLMFVAFGAGAVITGMARRQHGKAAVLGLIGCVLLMINVLPTAAMTIFAPQIARDLGLSMASTFFGILGFLNMALTLGGFGLLVAAVVARRTPQPQAPAWNQPQPGYGQQHGYAPPANYNQPQPYGQPQGYGQPATPHPGMAAPQPGTPHPGGAPAPQPGSAPTDQPTPPPANPQPWSDPNTPGQQRQPGPGGS